MNFEEKGEPKVKKFIFKVIVCILIGNLFVISPILFTANTAVATETADDEMGADEQYADEKSEYDMEEPSDEQPMMDDEQFVSDEDKGEEE